MLKQFKVGDWAFEAIVAEDDGSLIFIVFEKGSDWTNRSDADGVAISKIVVDEDLIVEWTL